MLYSKVNAPKIGVVDFASPKMDRLIYKEVTFECKEKGHL